VGAGATEVERVRVLVLGPLAVERDGQELHVAGAQRRRLLALLASNEGRPVSADAIAEALWGDEPPPTSTKAIQNHVARLRRSFAALDGELIATTTSGYRLAVAPEAIDGVDFEQRAADGRRLLANGDAAGAAGVLAAALAPRRTRTWVMRHSPSARRPGSTSCGGQPSRTLPRHGSRRAPSSRRSPTSNGSCATNPGVSAAGTC
jgi:DNA-binding SARP family transcriptional activator